MNEMLAFGVPGYIPPEHDFRLKVNTASNTTGQYGNLIEYGFVDLQPYSSYPEEHAPNYINYLFSGVTDDNILLSARLKNLHYYEQDDNVFFVNFDYSAYTGNDVLVQDSACEWHSAWWPATFVGTIDLTFDIEGPNQSTPATINAVAMAYHIDQQGIVPDSAYVINNIEPVPPTPSYHVYLIDTTTHTGSTKWALNFDKAIDMPYIRLYITAYIPSVSDLAVCNNVTGDWDNGMMIRLRSHNGLNWGFAISPEAVNNSLSDYTRITEVGSGSIIIKDGVRYHQTNLSTSSYHNIKLIFDRVNSKGYFYADETLYGTFDCNVDIGGLMNSLSLLQETKSPSCTYTSVIGFDNLQDAQDYTE